MRIPLTILTVSIRTAYTLLLIGFVIAISGCSGGSLSTVSSKNLDASPKVVRIALESPKNIYGLEDNIRISITFDQKVIVSSNGGIVPKIFLTLDGLFRNAHYTSGTGTNTLLFQYQVTNEDGVGNVKMASVIDLNGSFIVSSTGKAANLTLIPINIGSINSAAPSPPSNLSLSNPSTSPNSDPTPEILVSGVKPLATVFIVIVLVK